jgi:hypothetical protein
MTECAFTRFPALEQFNVWPKCSKCSRKPIALDNSRRVAEVQQVQQKAQ